MKQALNRWLTATVWVYFTFLFGWWVLYVITGDRLGYVALVNNLAVYLFSPLPIVLIIAFFVRRKEVWIGLLLGVIIFFSIWGRLLFNGFRRNQPPDSFLRVMTFNVLGRHSYSGPLVDNIRAEAPDVVFLQEINSAHAEVIKNKLIDEYPFQVLDPQDGVIGMGVISRYPLEITGDRLDLDWIGVPQILRMDWNEISITLVNFHMYPSGLAEPAAVEYVYRLRERQAKVLADFTHSATVANPVIAGGDANITHLSDAYKTITRSVNDAWWEAGFGLGHTFPGSAIPGSARPRIGGWPVPKWLARVDYVFISPHWEAYRVKLANFDGVSDHRGVVADLTLK